MSLIQDWEFQLFLYTSTITSYTPDGVYLRHYHGNVEFSTIRLPSQKDIVQIAWEEGEEDTTCL